VEEHSDGPTAHALAASFLLKKTCSAAMSTATVATAHTPVCM
jgi:hypothetical protein